MYQQFELSKETLDRIQQKVNDLQNVLITDEVIEEAFLNERKNLVRSAVNNIFMQSDYRKCLLNRMDTIVKSAMGIPEAIVDDAMINSKECGIKAGQVWSCDDNKIIVTAHSAHAVTTMPYSLAQSRPTEKI